MFKGVCLVSYDEGLGMGSKVIKAKLTELFAVSSVAAPFVGYGFSEWFGNDVYLILGAVLFCAWMMLVPVLLLGTYKRRIANRTAESSPDTTDAPDAPDAPVSSDA